RVREARQEQRAWMRDIDARDRLPARHAGELAGARPLRDQARAGKPRDRGHHAEVAVLAQRRELLPVERRRERLQRVRKDLRDREDAHYGLQIEDLIHAKQLEDRERLVARTRHLDVTTVAANALVELHERGDARAVDEVEAGQVDGNSLDLAGHELVDLLGELGRAVDIEAASDDEARLVIAARDVERVRHSGSP